MIKKIKNIFSANTFGDLKTEEENLKTRNRRKWFAVIIILLMVPFIPAFWGGLNSGIDDYFAGTKIPKNSEYASTEDNIKRAKPNEMKLWQIRQDRKNLDFEKTLNEAREEQTKDFENISNTLISEIKKSSEEAKNIIKQQNEKLEDISNQQVELKSNVDNTIDELKEDIVTLNEKINKVRTTSSPKIDFTKLSPITNGKDKVKKVTQSHNSGNMNFKKEILKSYKPKHIYQEHKKEIDSEIEDNYEEHYFADVADDSISIDTLVGIVGDEEKKKFIIPMGASEGITLTGATQKTMSTGKSPNAPIFVRLVGNFVTSNEKEFRIDGCSVFGGTSGDFGTGTSTVKFTKIQCLASGEDGDYIAEGEIKAWVFDESNLYGIESRVVSKEGEIFARAIPIALLKTATNSLSAAATTTTTNQDNATATAGITTVTGETNVIMDKIGELWLKYLDAVKPIVQFKAGRSVTVAFEQSTELVWKKVNLFDSKLPLGKNGKNGKNKNSRINYIEGNL